MEKKILSVKVAKKLLEGHQKGKVFLTKEGKTALSNLASGKE